LRDDFEPKTKETLALRVGCRCSNPKCRKLTNGPQTNPTKALNIGVAAHMAAASPGGKRYDARMSSAERKSINNGIWLCQNCAKLVDNDEQRYPTELLIEWKRLAEQAALQEIENVTSRDAGEFGIFHLPNPDPHFVGRNREIKLLADYFTQARSIVVEGLGGIGKTQLVLQTLNGREDRPTVWIDVESYQRVEDLRVALSAALQQMGMAASTASLLQVLHSAPIRVVFDGVEKAKREDWDDFEDFFRLLLSRTRTPQFIFTSQVDLNTLEPEKRLCLKPLEPEDAVTLLLTRGTEDKELDLSEANALTSLVDFSDGHVLTLRLIAVHLQRFGSASVVMERLQNIGTLALDQPIRKKQTKSTSLHVALRLAYEAITPEQRTLLLYLSYLPGGCWHLWLQHMGRSGDVQVDIAELHSWHLIERIHDDLYRLRYRVLSPIRAFVQATENTVNPDTAIAIRHEIAEKLMIQTTILSSEYMEFGGNAFWGVRRFEADLPNFLAALEYAYMLQSRASASGEEQDQQDANYLVYGFASGLSTYLFVRGHLHRGIEILRTGIDAGRLLGLECGSLYSMLIRICSRLHDSEKIRAIVSEFKTVAEQSEDLDLQARYEVAYADLEFSEKRYAEADAHYQKVEQFYTDALAKAVAEEDSESTRYITSSLALVLAQRADAREYMGDFKLGLNFGLRALNLFDSIGDQINIPNTQFHIGRCYVGLGKYSHALEAFTNAALQFYQMGTQQYLGNSLAEIGTLAMRGNVKSADLNLNEEIIAAGLADVADEMRNVLSNLPNVAFGWGLEVLRKSLAIMALASYEVEPDILVDWAFELRHDLIEPLIESGLVSRKKISDAGILLRELDLIAGVAFISAQLRAFNEPLEEGLQKLCRFCHNSLTGNWEISPFDWLASWINLHYPQQSLITAEQLCRAATRTFEHGQAFTIN